MSKVTGVILAGGRGARMGGADKGLQLLHGRPLVIHVLERLAPQVDEVLISANRNPEAYGCLGPRVVADASPAFLGPLAGLQRALAEATLPMVATVPCDAPFLPRDLVFRLLRALEAGEADAAVAVSGHRIQPVFALYRRSVLPMLEDFLAGDGRKVVDWQARLKLAEAPFEDAPAAFANLNSLEDLLRAERET
jgi:molybdopterin-guanine dinucleotide biosynthesis protein A